MKSASFCLIVLATAAIGACMKPAPGTSTSEESIWSKLVVGPDLEAKGPFGNHPVTLQPDGDISSMRIDLRPGASEEATLTHVISDTKPYLAGVTWRAFTPIVAETNATRMDYWIVGMNLSRTPDRSVYSVMRYPHSADLTAPGAHVEYALLSCDALAFARQASFETTRKTSISLDPAPAPEAGDCEFNSLKEAYAVAAKVLNAYDRVHREKDAPALDWQALKVILD